MLSSEKPRRRASPPAAEGRADPPWHQIPTAAARRLHQICVAKSSEVLGGFGLTPLQLGAMVHLNQRTGSPGIEQNGLASRLNIDRNTVSVLVEQLVKSGVVARQVNGADRRVRLLSLTLKGEKLYAELLPEFTVVNADILAPLAVRERKQFMDLLVRVIEGNLSDEAPVAPAQAKRSLINKSQEVSMQRMKLSRRQLVHLAAGTVALSAVRTARADTYPVRPVRIMVGFPPGITPDIAARIIAQRLSQQLGQQFIVENRTGAAGNIATESSPRPSRTAIRSC